MRLTEEHEAIRDMTARFIDNEINPYCDEWEEQGIFPAHELFKKIYSEGPDSNEKNALGRCNFKRFYSHTCCRTG